MQWCMNKESKRGMEEGRDPNGNRKKELGIDGRMCRDRVWVLMRYIKKYEFTSEEIVAVGSRYHMEDMVVCVMDKLHSIFPMAAVLLPVLESGHIGNTKRGYSSDDRTAWRFTGCQAVILFVQG